jgi:hypothetical protein
MATPYERQCNRLHEQDDSEDQEFFDVELGDEITIDIDGEAVTGRVGWFMDGGFALLSHELPEILTTHEIIDLEGAPFVVGQIQDGVVVLLITDQEDSFDGGYWVAGEPWEVDQDAPLDEEVQEARRVRRRFTRTKSGGYKRKRTKRSTSKERMYAKKYWRAHRREIKKKRKIRKRKPTYKAQQRKLSRVRGSR